MLALLTDSGAIISLLILPSSSREVHMDFSVGALYMM